MAANDEVFFDIPVEIRSELDRKIYDAFKVYDFRCVNMVDVQHLGSILRFLGCVPLVVSNKTYKTALLLLLLSAETFL